MPVTICKFPGCNKRIPYKEQYCDEHKKVAAKQRYRAEKRYECREYQYLYHSTRWKMIRIKQLERQPLCEDCLQHGRVTLATVADHIVDHKGNKYLFYHGQLQSLCWSCHSSKTMKDQHA